MNIALATSSACGPLRHVDCGRRLMVDLLPRCRVPARRPGDFHLRPQMKVTKAKGLNAKPFGSFFALEPLGPAGHLETPPELEPTTHSAGLAERFGLGPAHGRRIPRARYSEARASSALSRPIAAVVHSGPPGAYAKRRGPMRLGASFFAYFLSGATERKDAARRGGIPACNAGNNHQATAATERPLRPDGRRSMGTSRRLPSMVRQLK